MKIIKQLSIFAENKMGKIEKITRSLSDKNINILAINITSMGDFGVLKFVVDKPEEALEEMKKQGFTASLNDTLAIELPKDKPGSIHDIAESLAKKNINVENAGVLVEGDRNQAYMLIEVKNTEQAKKMLEK